MKKKLTLTKDGSHTFYLEEMDEHYHSKHGSVAESQHIFIQAGLLEKLKSKKQLSIFEVGMGTGLNVFLTALALENNLTQVEMHTIEAYPISESEAKILNYPQLLGGGEAIFEKIHAFTWNENNSLTENLELRKFKADLSEHQFKHTYDLIYFDAFAPEKQAEMWGDEIFQKIFNAMNADGILVTYCVKGVIRRRLQSIGFEVEKLAGPVGGKREMLRAWKR